MNDTTKLGLFLFFIVIFWSIFIFYIALASLPYNPISPPFLIKRDIISFLPEGWGFFTRDPQESEIYIYKKVGSELVSYSIHHSRPNNYFGLKRNSRAQMVELEFLIRNIKEVDWIECEDEINNCLSQETVPEFHLNNNSVFQSLCGVIWLQKKKPVPWAWSKSRDNINMPSIIIKLNIECKQ